MHDKIVEWVKSCTDSLIDDFSGNEEALMLIKVFVTQYELRSIELNENKNLKFRKLRYLKNKILSFFKKITPNKLNFSFSFNQLDILFWPFQESHLDFQIPIFNSFRISELKTDIFSHKPSINNLLNKRKTDNNIENESTHWGHWRDYKKDNNYKAIVNNALNLPPLLIGDKPLYFKDVLLSCWDMYYWLYSYTVDVFYNSIKNASPKSIVVGNNMTLVGNTIGHLAKNMNIKVFCIMHGRMGSYPEYSSFDYFYLFGNRDRINLEKLGIPSSKLIVSGSSKIDNYLIKRKKINNLTKINKVVIALSGPGHSITEKHHIKILHSLYVAANRLTEIEFLFKLHKKDRLKYYLEFYNLKNVRIYEHGNKSISSNIYDWLLEASTLITAASTTALDAMILGVPVITIDRMNHLSNVDFIKEGITMHSNDDDSLINRILEIKNKNIKLENHLILSQKYIKDMYVHPNKGTVDFISSHINTILKG